VFGLFFYPRRKEMKRLLALTLSLASIGFVASSAEAGIKKSSADRTTPANVVRQDIHIRIGNGGRRYDNRRYNRSSRYYRGYNRGYYRNYNRSSYRSYNRGYYPAYNQGYARRRSSSSYSRGYYPSYYGGSYYRTYNNGYNRSYAGGRARSDAARRAYMRGFMRGYSKGYNRRAEGRYARRGYLMY
jgi:hypothetical protein